MRSLDDPRLFAPSRGARSALCILGSFAILVAPPMTSPTPPSPPPAAITKAQAVEIAQKALSELKPGTEFVILEDKTMEKEFGWVFRYVTKKYAETNDPQTLIRGTGPLVVERVGGAAQFLTTSVPPEKAIQEFEKRWRKNRDEKKK